MTVENNEVRVSKIKGVTFENRQVNVKALIQGQTIFFKPEPENPYDANAIKLFADRECTKELGHVDSQLLKDMVGYTIIDVMVRSVGAKHDTFGANIAIVFQKKI